MSLRGVYVHLRSSVLRSMTVCGVSARDAVDVTRDAAELRPELVTCPACRELMEAGE